MYSFTEVAGTFLWTHALSFTFLTLVKMFTETHSWSTRQRLPWLQWEISERSTSKPLFQNSTAGWRFLEWNCEIFSEGKRSNMRACSCPDGWGKWSRHMIRAKERENRYTVRNNPEFVSRRKARPFPAWNTAHICLCNVALWAMLAWPLVSRCFSPFFLLQHGKGIAGPESFRPEEACELDAALQRSSLSWALSDF